MANRFDVHVRLEAIHAVGDPRAVRDALRAEAHDPLWFLGRQWQLGEHRGRDAASPALVHLTVNETPITGRSPAPEDDPRITPPEVVVESEPEQWWTIGRRVRVGRALRSQLAPAQRRDARLLFAGLPAPYDRLNGAALDGLALHRDRAILPLADALFVAQGVPRVEPPDDWQPAELAYSGSFAAGPVTLSLPRHDGNDVDWYSTVASGGPPPAAAPVVRTSYPTRVTFPGAAHPRWWQIEDHRVDPGAVPPARTHLAALLVVHATAAHADDWFTTPLLAPSGTLVSVLSMTVVDVMDVETTNVPVPDWSLFHVSGLGTEDLLLWPTVANRLSAPSPLDEVLVGVDEDANLLWAVERRADGVELVDPDEAPPPVTTQPGEVVVGGPRRYRYVPATRVPRRWHPYITSDAGGVRRYVQARLADMDVRPLAARPGPVSRLLRDPAATASTPAHQVFPNAVPRRGVKLDRRFVLGRRTDGQPALWVQRRRLPLSAPPASELRFDELEDIT